MEQNLIPRPSGPGKRHIVAWLGFMSFVVNYGMRFNLSLAIVAMVRHKSYKSHKTLDYCGNSTLSNIPNNMTIQALPIQDEYHLEYDLLEWNEEEQGLILGSFFWGYVLTGLIGGILAQKYGAKWVISAGLMITAVLTVSIPFVSYMGKESMVALRAMQGLCEGVTVPALQVLMSKWAPPGERGEISTIIYSGIPAGTALTTVTSGYIIEYLGWPFVFYIMGGSACVWFVLWTIFVFDSPAEHPTISKAEADYIRKSIGDQHSKIKPPTPWSSILTSLPVLAVYVSHASFSWTAYTTLAQLPTYIKTVLDYDIRENKWISASPHIIKWIFASIVTRMADSMIRNKYLSIGVSRKLCNTIGQWLSGICFLILAYSGCNKIFTIIMINVAVGIMGCVYGGFVVNSLDLAPNHLGVIMGIDHAVANSCGFIAPYVAGRIIKGNPSIEQWRLVFIIAAGIQFIGNLFYILFGSAKEQPWNRTLVRSEEFVDLRNLANAKRLHPISKEDKSHKKPILV